MLMGFQTLARFALVSVALIPAALARSQQTPAEGAPAAAPTTAKAQAKKADAATLHWATTGRALPAWENLHFQNAERGALAQWLFQLDSKSDANALGANLGQPDRAVRAQLGLPDGRGLVMFSLTPGGPAAQAGLAENDILLTLGEKPLEKAEDLYTRLKEAGEKPVALSLLRGGKPLKLQIKPVYNVSFTSVGPEATKYYIGVPVKAVDATLRSHLTDLPEGQGMVAESIEADSPAAKAGLQPDDILLSIGDKPITDAESLVAQIQASSGKRIHIKILRKAKPMTIDVTPVPRKADGVAEVAAQANVFYTSQMLDYAAMAPYIITNRTGNDAIFWQNFPAQQLTANTQLTNLNSAAEGDRVEKRVEALTKEVEELRKAIEMLTKSLKK
jgi:serine protease Do